MSFSITVTFLLLSTGQDLFQLQCSYVDFTYIIFYYNIVYTNKADADRIPQFVISEQGFHSLVCPVKCVQLLNRIVTKNKKLKANQREILFVALNKTLFPLCGKEGIVLLCLVLF